MKIKQITIILIIAISFIITSCSGDFAGDGTGNVTINIGSDSRSAAWPPTDQNGILPNLNLNIQLKGPTGTQNHKLEPGVTSANYTLATGQWEITIEAWFEDALFARGTNSLNVTGGQNNVTIPMGEETLFYYVANADDWEKAIETINEKGNNRVHIVTVTADFTLPRAWWTIGFENKISGSTVTLRGKYTVSISNSSKGCLLQIFNNNEVIIQDLALKGHLNNDAPMIQMGDSSLVMKGTSSISGNNSDWGGGGIIAGKSSIIMQDDSSIHNNTTPWGGGGIKIDNNSSLLMQDNASVHSNKSIEGSGGGIAAENSNIIIKGSASVHKNYALWRGGGVAVHAGTFLMQDNSSVHSNNAKDGGGVLVENVYYPETGIVTVPGGGKFTMSGYSSVHSNEVVNRGGGVVMYGSNFTMQDNASVYKNIAKGEEDYGGGGGICLSLESNLTMNGNASVYENTAEYYGGGVELVGGSSLTMASGTINDNEASDGGGGVFVNESTFIMNSGIISDNEALYGFGGGVFIFNSSFTMNNGTISNNESFGTFGGGGVFIHNSSFTMNNGKISDNEASGYGGGVFIYVGTFTMNNGTISDNEALRGGGVYIYESIFIMKNGFIRGNNAATGGGIAVENLGTFYISGGTVYGDNAGIINSNIAPSGGNALYYYSISCTAEYGTFDSADIWNKTDEFNDEENDTFTVVNGVISYP